MSKVDKLILQARPPLSKVAPIVFWVSLGYGIVNLVLAVGMYNFNPTVGLAIVTGFFTYQFWAAVFLVAGIGMLYAIHKNDWLMLRGFLIIGLVVKLMWLIALIFRVLEGGSIFLVAIWLFFAYVQAITIIFMPVVDTGGDKK